ncbi:MAG TPA: DUF1824 family protein [Elainellaceae cyanobacterium]|jgi:hypothetical protein
MSNSQSDLPLDDARQTLKRFDCLANAHVSDSDKALIRRALRQVIPQSDHQILGICADDLQQGCAALQSYAEALGYSVNADLKPIDGSVYIKFNPKSGLLYADVYTGEHRGVLVSCQSDDDSGLNDMFGHLPLDLFLNDE